ncbi:MAG TPA: hypothetical protein VEU33_30640 [Archangium sp.]|nr:hypothetical protein [Archangium sp.]
MKLNDAIVWFDELAQRSIPRLHRRGWTNVATGETVSEYEARDAVKWITEAESALKAVFPSGHPLVKRWDSILAPADRNPNQLSEDSVIDAARALFETARSQLKAGRIAGLVDAIHAETTGELLDQAEALLAKGYLAAASVIAGGALESFLRHLCVRNAITWSGEGSITRYESALAQSRNSGNEIISSTDGKLVTSWGGMRNDAAHSPGTFNRRADEVRLMVDGIRHFVARFPS